LTLSDTDDNIPGVGAGKLELRSKPHPLSNHSAGMILPQGFLYVLANNCLWVYCSDSAQEDMDMNEPEPVIFLPSAGKYTLYRVIIATINSTYSSRNTRTVPEPHHDC
jgi:hypothetical protein